MDLNSLKIKMKQYNYTKIYSYNKKIDVFI